MLDRARRIRGEKSLRGLRVFQRRPESPDILLERGLAHVLERRNADRELQALRGAGERAPAAREVPGEILRIAGGDVEGGRIQPRPVVAHLEAGEALANVIGEVGLAE